MGAQYLYRHHCMSIQQPTLRAEEQQRSITVKETGILFTPDNIRAIREDRKTQTRRVIVPQPKVSEEEANVLSAAWINGFIDEKCPYGVVGDRLYIKEGVIVQGKYWSEFTGKPDGTLVGYYMDGRRVENSWEKRLTAMFMAKQFARTWLDITDVRVERLQEISEEDARAEGISVLPLQSENDPSAWYQSAPGIHQDRTARGSYAQLWDSINGKRGYTWESNPWVWALTFAVGASPNPPRLG